MAAYGSWIPDSAALVAAALMLPISAPAADVPPREGLDASPLHPLCGDPDVVERIERRFRDGGLAVTRGVLRGIVAYDIGDIAVLEDDGTLVPGLVTNTPAIANAFYASHADDYDHIIIFIAEEFPGNVQPETGFAFFSRVSHHASGIGINHALGEPSEAGGINRLLGVVNMNDTPEYPASPTQTFYFSVGSLVEILGHEVGHAFCSFVQPGGGLDILGRQNSHWSFFLHHPGANRASVLEGNAWQDNSDGTFTTVAAYNGFSELDLYLMGLRSAIAVQPMYVITPPPFPDATFPAVGVTVPGTASPVTVGDVVANHGPRDPAFEASPKVFKTAFVFVTPSGVTPTAITLNRLNTWRTAWRTWFSTATDGAGAIDTTLGPGAPTLLPFSDDFNSPEISTADWTYIQNATIDPLGTAEPSGDSSLRLDGGPGRGDEVRSRPIDLSAQGPGAVRVRYWTQRTGGAGASPVPGEDLLVEYRTNTGLWATLNVIPGDGPDEAGFTLHNHILPDDGLHSRLQLRFHRAQGRQGDVGVFFVDDASVYLTGEACAPDFNGDGQVGGADLSILLGQWGQSGSFADITGDGEVDGADLSVLLGEWGPCD